MFDVFYWGPKPGLFAFEQPADFLDDAASKCRTTHYWYIYGGNDYTGFDFDYVPVPWETTHVHVFPSQWQRDSGVYLANKNTVQNKEWHFRTEQSVTRKADLAPWTIPQGIDREAFDFSWHPDVHEPAYTYHFGTQWQSAGGPVYTGTAGIKIIDTPRAIAIASKDNWAVPDEVNANAVDFSWHPNPLDPAYIYHFGTDWQASVGLTYTVPTATEIKFAGPIPGTENALEVQDIFFIDKGNDTATTRYELLRGKHGDRVTKVRYANSLIDTITRCSNRTTTNKFWVVSSEYDYTDFDFSWHAEPWQNFMTHVFPSQHQKWSDTFLINQWEFNRHAGWAKTLEQFPNLNFVQDQTVTKSDSKVAIYYVDHGDITSQHQYDFLRADCVGSIPIIKTRFVDNYLDTFKRIMTTAETEYVWIINSICNYSQFDFTWEPEPWQREMIHVFPSDNQPRGDTFYIHIESFKRQMIELELLDWFNVINYCEDQRVERFPVPIHTYDTDDLVTEIKNYEFRNPYTVFTNQKDIQLLVAPCLWTKKDRVVQRLSRSGATVAVPRDIKADLVSQIYDYPYISDKKPGINDYFGDRRIGGLDIIYISNGEPDEERWYEHLCYQSNHHAKWVRGINGRTAAYQEAARQSDTPWFFAVFAKLEVLGNAFPWYEWMPDFFQEPKHYIFNARNPVNGLEYGHQGMICYNKRLVLENTDPGIDFTLSQPHESVPILSGIAHYNQSEWMTWRTAFREVVKLKHFMAIAPTLETEHRLDVWCNEHRLVVGAPFAQWSVRGAQDAVEYYTEVNGDYERLKLSFDWAWLQERFNSKTK
jgi:hypothetical protein